MKSDLTLLVWTTLITVILLLMSSIYLPVSSAQLSQEAQKLKTVNLKELDLKALDELKR